MFRSMAERKVRAAGFDPERLPPGQYMTKKWPVLHAGQVPKVDLATWTLPRLRRGRGGGRARPGSSSTSCRARARRRTSTASRAGAASTRSSRASAGARSRSSAGRCRQRAVRDRPRRARLHRERARSSRSSDDDALLVTARRRRAADAATTAGRCASSSPASTSGRAPSGCAAIELSAVDQPGFWERYGYHNDADPWKEEGIRSSVVISSSVGNPRFPTAPPAGFLAVCTFA